MKQGHDAAAVAGQQIALIPDIVNGQRKTAMQTLQYFRAMAVIALKQGLGMALLPCQCRQLGILPLGQPLQSHCQLPLRALRQIISRQLCSPPAGLQLSQ